MTSPAIVVEATAPRVRSEGASSRLSCDKAEHPFQVTSVPGVTRLCLQEGSRGLKCNRGYTEKTISKTARHQELRSSGEKRHKSGGARMFCAVI